jgi:hypothetical protein
VDKLEEAPSERTAHNTAGSTTAMTESLSGEKVRKSVQREVERQKRIEEREQEKKYLEEKYDANLKDSDDSSDEEVLLRTGNIPKHWYELYDHKGYSVSGK